MRRLYVFALIAALSFALKAPVALQRFRAHPDALAYVNIARNVADGRGFTSTLKLNYFTDSPVTHCALSDWPPLYPLFAGAAMSVGIPETGLQVASALFAALAAGLVFLIGERLFGRPVGIVSGLFAAIAPNVFRAGIAAMSDAMGLALALAAVLAAISAEDRKTRWLVTGALAGAACLVRYPNAVLAAAFVVWLLRRREFACAGACAVGFGVLVAPVIVLGGVTASTQAFHFAVGSYSAAARSYGAPVGFGYAASHAGEVIAAIGRNAAFYAVDLLAGLRGLFALGAGLIVFVLKRGSTVSGLKSRNTGAGLVTTIALLNVAAYALAWSAPPVRGSRFLLLSYCLLLPVCVAGIERIGRVRVRTAIYTMVAAAYVYGAVTAAVSHDHELRPLDARLVARIRTELPARAVIASNNPWAVNRSTGHPCAILPHNLDAEEMRAFCREYGVAGTAVVGIAKRHRAAALYTTARTRSTESGTRSPGSSKCSP